MTHGHAISARSDRHRHRLRLAGQIVKGYGFGLVGNLVVGALGSLIVGWGLPKLGVALPAIGTSWILNAIVYGTLGAVVLLLIVGMVRRSA